MARKPKITTIEDFELAARKLGATIEVHERMEKYGDDLTAPFTSWSSEYEGGCGSEGCECSPDLWVSASEKKVAIVAKWAMSPAGHKAWAKLRKMVGVS